MSTSAPAQPTAPNAYGQAMDATRDAFTRRAAQYKWLVICMVTSSLACLGLALALSSLQILCALLLLPSIVLGFFVLDSWTVHRWRRDIMQTWSQGRLRLAVLAQTLRTVPNLPSQTLEGMLACFPGQALDDVPPPWRAKLQSLQEQLARWSVQRALLRATLWAGLVVVPLAAMGIRRIEPLAVWALLLLLAWGMWLTQHRRLRRERTILLEACKADGLKWGQLCVWLESLDWQGVSPRLRRALLAP